MHHRTSHLIQDLGIIALSVGVAVLLVRTGSVERLLVSVGGFTIFGSFFAGIFFVSAFTVAPAAAVLVEFFRANSLLEVAFAGGLGALAGDYLMFRFLRDRVAEDIASLLRHSRLRRLLAVFRLRCFRWVTPLAGALIVASPFPDEIGLALMGLSRLRTAIFLPISFALNFLGILAMGLAVKAIA